MNDTGEAVIVGAGIMGGAIAQALAERGMLGSVKLLRHAGVFARRQ